MRSRRRLADLELRRGSAPLALSDLRVRRNGLEHATRSGGHCFAGRSSTRGVVIDVTPLASVSGSEATVGAGARLGSVYEALQEHGLTIPGGSRPPVGIAGLALGRGLGIRGRK